LVLVRQVHLLRHGSHDQDVKFCLLTLKSFHEISHAVMGSHLALSPNFIALGWKSG
jgi:hypothetical protein